MRQVSELSKLKAELKRLRSEFRIRREIYNLAVSIEAMKNGNMMYADRTYASRQHQNNSHSR